jgi:hypothetical protein
MRCLLQGAWVLKNSKVLSMLEWLGFGQNCSYGYGALKPHCLRTKHMDGSQSSNETSKSNSSSAQNSRCCARVWCDRLGGTP